MIAQRAACCGQRHGYVAFAIGIVCCVSPAYAPPAYKAPASCPAFEPPPVHSSTIM